MSALVFVSHDAEDQIRRIDTWWRENRPWAPNLFVEELAAGFELLSGSPRIGRSYRHQIQGIRRLLLRATRNHVYYKIHDETVIVLAVRGAIRGVGPDLRPSQ